MKKWFLVLLFFQSEFIKSMDSFDEQELRDLGFTEEQIKEQFLQWQMQMTIQRQIMEEAAQQKRQQEQQKEKVISVDDSNDSELAQAIAESLKQQQKSVIASEDDVDDENPSEKIENNKEGIIDWIRRIVFERSKIGESKSSEIVSQKSQNLVRFPLSKSISKLGLGLGIKPKIDQSCLAQAAFDQIDQPQVAVENFSLIQKTVIPQAGAQCGKEAMINAHNVIAEFLGIPNANFVSGEYDRSCDWLELEGLGQLWEKKYGIVGSNVAPFVIVSKDLENMNTDTLGVELPMMLESILNQSGKQAVAVFINTSDQKDVLEQSLRGRTAYAHWFTVVILKEDGLDDKPFVRFIVMDSLGNVPRTDYPAVKNIINQVKTIFEPTVRSYDV